jgi:dTDP-3-amino-2,3,6-trideoxy-4-keto-D-glucose/dTDP-3-amino-3,4,6-trideoxy-alpha-D-glucose/dTDP-2,6-dideoxy-D-kanosamine transaminase
VGSDIHYPIPDHKQRFFQQHFAGATLPVTEQLAGEVLTLPCFPEMSEEQVGHVIHAVNSWSA